MSTRFLVIGPYASGRTQTLKAFRDLGFMTLSGSDSFTQAVALLETMAEQSPKAEGVAVSLSLLPTIPVESALEDLAQLKERLGDVKVLYLSSPITTLNQRVASQEMPHPYEQLIQLMHWGQTLSYWLDQEQELYKALKPLTDYHIDTSAIAPRELFHKVAKVLNKPVEAPPLSIEIVSFGFKNGVPSDCDLVFDVRFLPNPFYEPELRPMSGLDKPVSDYVMKFPETQTFLEHWTSLIGHTLPLYQKQGRTRLTIAVGCTGGQHRSVALAHSLGQYLNQHFPDFKAHVTHRERQKWPQSAQDSAKNSQACPA